jgi:hypothetical protein
MVPIARVFATGNPFQTSLMFARMAGAYGKAHLEQTLVS